MSERAQLSRRAFVARALAVGAAVAVSDLAVTTSRTADAAEPTRTAWTLEPDWGYPRGAHGRTSCHCSACRHHADNKIFATQGDADEPTLRAHTACLCVATTVAMSSEKYNALFGDGRRVVDRRDPAVAAILAATPADPPSPSSTAPGSTTPVVTDPPSTDPTTTQPPTTPPAEPTTTQPTTTQPTTTTTEPRPTPTRKPTKPAPTPTKPSGSVSPTRTRVPRPPSTTPMPPTSSAPPTSPAPPTRSRPVHHRKHHRPHAPRPMGPHLGPPAGNLRAGVSREADPALSPAAFDRRTGGEPWSEFGVAGAVAATVLGGLVWLRNRGAHAAHVNPTAESSLPLDRAPGTEEPGQ